MILADPGTVIVPRDIGPDGGDGLPSGGDGGWISLDCLEEHEEEVVVVELTCPPDPPSYGFGWGPVDSADGFNWTPMGFGVYLHSREVGLLGVRARACLAEVGEAWGRYATGIGPTLGPMAAPAVASCVHTSGLSRQGRPPAPSLPVA